MAKAITEAQEHVVMQLAMLYQQQHLPIGLINRQFETFITLELEQLVLSLRAFALADDGERFHETHTWEQYRFPWYTPRWLRRRRTTTKTITLTYQGKVIYPEQRVISELGRGVRIVEFYTHGETPHDQD